MANVLLYITTKLHQFFQHAGKRQRYILHHKNAFLYSRLGAQITKVHRALRFIQAPFLKPWQVNTECTKKTRQYTLTVFRIDLCTEKRKEASAQGDAGSKNFWWVY